MERQYEGKPITDMFKEGLDLYKGDIQVSQELDEQDAKTCLTFYSRGK